MDAKFWNCEPNWSFGLVIGRVIVQMVENKDLGGDVKT